MQMCVHMNRASRIQDMLQGPQRHEDVKTLQAYCPCELNDDAHPHESQSIIVAACAMDNLSNSPRPNQATEVRHGVVQGHGDRHALRVVADHWDEGVDDRI